MLPTLRTPSWLEKSAGRGSCGFGRPRRACARRTPRRSFCVARLCRRALWHGAVVRCDEAALARRVLCGARCLGTLCGRLFLVAARAVLGRLALVLGGEAFLPLDKLSVLRFLREPAHTPSRPSQRGYSAAGTRAGAPGYTRGTRRCLRRRCCCRRSAPYPAVGVRSFPAAARGALRACPYSA